MLHNPWELKAELRKNPSITSKLFLSVKVEIFIAHFQKYSAWQKIEKTTSLEHMITSENSISKWLSVCLSLSSRYMEAR